MLRLLLLLTLAAMTPDMPQATPASALPMLSHVAQPAPGIITAGRIDAAAVQTLADAGVQHVIDLTAPGEQPGFDEAAAVRAAGLGYDNLVINGPADLTRETAQAFDRLLGQADRPVLVHCASSNRVGALAALRAAWIEGLPMEQAIAEGRRWGLASLEPAVRERLAQRDDGNAR